MNFLKDLKKQLKDDNTHILEDGENSAEFTSYVDTGCYSFNALLSGSVFGGMPDNKVLMFGGDPAAGKCARGSQYITVYMDKKTKEKLNL